MPPNYLDDPMIQSYLPLVDAHFKSASEQHPARKWEYGMALAAGAAHGLFLGDVAGGTGQPLRCLDVGGAGSPLARMLAASHCLPLVVDPSVAPEHGFVGDIEAYAKATPRPHVSTIFSISVLEHVPGVPHFLAACDRVLLPGGLLFLTVDAWDPPFGTLGDTAHMHWMRQRIYTPTMLTALQGYLMLEGYAPLGDTDFTWPGAGVYDYSFASLAFVRKG